MKHKQDMRRRIQNPTHSKQAVKTALYKKSQQIFIKQK